ncbi:MAG TPA: mechanosensitive ion channel family protein [Methylophilaceae bacterium]|nr:mechanosensitive ion channel family protein [Methylophilaceae bacterium]
MHLSAPAFHILIILVLAAIAFRLSRRLIRVLKEFMLQRAEDNPEEFKRIETLGRVFRYITSVVITIVAGMLILSELGISIAPILAAAGVLGLAIGFGAQSLVKDYFSGFFLLLENQIRQGDVVNVADKGGFVEEMTLRYVKMRDYEGNVHFIPNGIITTVTNMSRQFAYAVIDIGVSYREDVDEVIAVMEQVGKELREDEALAPKILANIEIAGVDQFADSSVIIKCRFMVQALEQWTVKRAYLKRIKEVFDERGIEIPFPHLTIYPGVLKDGSAPALRIGAAQEAMQTPS